MTQELKNTQNVVVKIDAALKRLYTQAINQLNEAKREGAEAWHKRYLTLANVVEHKPPLYLAGGYATDKEFFDAEAQETQQSVSRHTRVAKLATPAEVAKYSPTRLYWGIAYIEAKQKGPLTNRGSIDFDKLRIQFKRDGKAMSKGLLQLALSELRAAVRLATGHEAKKPKETPAAKAIDAAMKKAGVKSAKVTVSKTTLVLRVPLTGVAAVARELADFVLPKGGG